VPVRGRVCCTVFLFSVRRCAASQVTGQHLRVIGTWIRFFVSYVSIRPVPRYVKGVSLLIEARRLLFLVVTAFCVAYPLFRSLYPLPTRSESSLKGMAWVDWVGELKK